MDRGFVNFSWFRQLNESGVLFITRIKKDTAYEVVESHAIMEGKGSSPMSGFNGPAIKVGNDIPRSSDW
jgi:hypothetical protein